MSSARGVRGQSDDLVGPGGVEGSGTHTRTGGTHTRTGISVGDSAAGAPVGPSGLAAA
jgi:hypothetical protein